MVAKTTLGVVAFSVRVRVSSSLSISFMSTANRIIKLSINNNQILSSNNNNIKIDKNFSRLSCIITDRNRAIIHKNFKLSRMIFRSLADIGFIPGLRRAR